MYGGGVPALSHGAARDATMTLVMRTYPGDDPTLRAAGTRAAVTAMRSGRLVLAPADFHYAVIADAFSVPGVQRLREVRGIAEG